MKHTIVMCCSCALGLIAGLSGAAPADAPFSVPDVPAKLMQVRNGLGHVRAKLETGQPATIAYFGTSITWPDGYWRTPNLAWFKKTYPKAAITEVNAAIGATGSPQGVFRVEEHLLRFKPDLVFIEFSINDIGVTPEAVSADLEGIVRQIWQADPQTDICLVHMYHHEFVQALRDGKCTRSQAAHEVVAEHYGIPSVNVAVRINELAGAGKLLIAAPKDASGQPLPAPEGVPVYSIGDGVHPVSNGTSIIAQTMTEALKTIFAAPAPAVPRTGLPPLLVPGNRMERARMAPVKAAMLSSGWTQLDGTTAIGRLLEPGCGGPYKMGGGWATQTPGATLRFRFKGPIVRLYDIAGPDGGQFAVMIDGRTNGVVSRFNPDHWPTVASLADNLEDTEHEVIVTVCDRSVPDQRRQTLVEKLKQQTDFDPKQLDGAWIRIARILVVGEMLDP